MADLPSILGGLAQGFVDFGKGAVDMFGTGGAAIGDLIEGARTGKVTTKNQDDFRKWLYQTDSTKDAAAKGLGTALNGVQTVLDYIPGVNVLTRNPLGNAAQGALGGLADEFKTYGEDYDLGRAGQRAAVSGAAAAASGSLADALKGSSNALLSSNTLQGLARGATGGAITGGGYAAIDGGDVLEAAKQGAGMGALIGGATGAFQDFKPAKTYDVALTDDERAARIANAQKQIDDIGPVRRFTDDPNELAKRARVNELQDAIKAYQSGHDTVQDYNDALAARRANRQPSLTREEYEAKMQQRIRDLGGNYEVTPEKQAQFDRLQKVNPMRDDYHTGIRAPQDIATLQEAINNAKDIDPAYKAMLQKALADDSVTVYSSYPIEEGVFTTPIKQMAQDYAGPGNQVYSKTISPNDIAWIDDQEGNYIPRLQQLETTLSDADMAVNNPKLTPEQEAYFKDSVIRDENGNLMPMYHGTPDGSFTVFNEGSYFTPNKEYADGYQWEGASVLRSNKKAVNPKTFEVYIDSKKPFTLSDPKARDIYLNEYIKGGNSMYYDPYSDWTKAVKDLQEVDWTEGEDLRAWLKENHPEYDALYLDEGGDGGYGEAEYKWRGKSLIPFESNQIKDINNLAPTDAPDIMAEMIPEDMDLGRTLAGQDMAVNSAKIAPGQLGLFDDMPTQTPKTGTRQTSLFDQPDNPYLDYYGADIDATPLTPEAPANPYAPVNGEVTQAMRDRAADILGNWKKNGVPENELYNAIDPETLPAAIKGAKTLDVDNLKNVTKNIFGVDDIKKADMNKVIEYAYSDSPNLVKYYSSYIKSEPPKSGIYKRIQKEAYEVANAKMMDEMTQQLLDSSVIDSSNLRELRRYSPADHATRSGYTAAADEVLSERLGIAPGNTPKYNGRQDVRNAYGRYSHPALSAGGDLAIFERKMSSPEDAVSTIAHERLHSFQGEAESRNQARYNQEVIDAYNDLHNELKNHYKDWSDTAERYGHRDTGYWQRADEQEARMLQTYLENKGYAQAEQMQSKYRKGEWGNEINPAFDKFFDKLRDLSKRGVALPALAALFGGGAYMASQEKDKEKEVK